LSHESRANCDYFAEEALDTLTDNCSSMCIFCGVWPLASRQAAEAGIGIHYLNLKAEGVCNLPLNDCGD
jgi:hypothetical protein